MLKSRWEPRCRTGEANRCALCRQATNAKEGGTGGRELVAQIVPKYPSFCEFCHENVVGANSRTEKSKYILIGVEVWRLTAVHGSVNQNVEASY